MSSYVKKFVYFFLILLTGCSASESNSGKNVISVKVDEFSPVTDFFDSYKFVVLETTDGSLISNESIFRTSDRYIVSYSPQSGFVIFDKEGKYMNSFDHTGEGPEEYMQLTDYYIKNETIYAVAGFLKKFWNMTSSVVSVLQFILLMENMSMHRLLPMRQ